MRIQVLCLAAVLAATPAWAQQPTPPDTTRHQHGDTLTRSPTQLHEVTVTAAPTRRQDPVFSVELKQAALERVPATDAWDLLRQAGGIEIHQQGQGPGFASDASLRGFSSDHSTDIALWIDGVPINEPVNGHAEGYNDWNLMFPQAVSDIAVTRGPSNPVFGNFALAGAVNVRTLERFDGSTLWFDGGSYGRLEGGFMTGRNDEKTGAVLAIRGARDGGWRPNSKWDLGQLHGRVVRTVSSKTTLDAGIELYATGWDSPGFLTEDQFDARDYDVVVDPTDGGFKRRAQERVSLRMVAGPNLLWRSTVYATQGRWQLFLNIPPEPGEGEGTGGQTEEEDKRYGFGATTALSYALNRVEMTLGAEGRLDHADYENWLTQSRQRIEPQIQAVARQLSGGIFLQSSLDLTPHLRLNVGGRLDALDTRSTPEGELTASDTKTIATPKLGALYHLPRLGAVYVNVSRGFRQADGVITDPAIPFITSWAYEAGFKVDQPWLSGNLALFLTDVSNEQTFDPITLQTTNGGSSRRQGVEVEFAARLARPLQLTGDWTFTDAKYRDFIIEDGEELTGTRIFNTAEYVGVTALDLEIPRQPWHARVATNVVGPYTPFDEPGVSLPAYALFHLSGDVRLGAATLELGVRNLLNHAYPEIRAGGFVAPGQPRTVYAGVKYAINRPATTDSQIP
jgi:outer membrane receptor protein involved in Fe transport